MATTNKKINFSYFERKQDFTTALQAELANNIVFVEDTKEVFTHGEFFGIRNVTLNYDSSTTRLQLKDGGVVVSEMDATAFVKDGMLDSVSLVKTQEPGVSEAVPYLKFVFNTDAGKSAVRLSVSDLVDSYDGSSIALTQAFAPASSYSAPAAGDSVDVAVGKLLKGHSDNVTALSGKQVAITGAATTVTLNDLTTDRALISSGSGKIAVSSITATELGYLSGVTSAVQTQLDSKQGTLTFDDAPTVDSNNVVKSGGVDTAIKNAQRVFYAVTQTAGATAVKEFTISDFPTETINGVKTPLKGTILIAQCANADARTAQLKFKVNDGGEFPIKYADVEYTGTSQNTTILSHIRNYVYVFNGTHWAWVSEGRDADTTYTPQSLGFGYASCTTSAATAAKTATLSSYNLVNGGLVVVYFQNDVPAQATLNINRKGAKQIHFQNARIAANVIKAGDRCLFIYNGNYLLIAIDRWGKELQEKVSGINISETDFEALSTYEQGKLYFVYDNNS